MTQAIQMNESGSGSVYDGIVARMAERFDRLGVQPLFTTDASGLFDAYLASFPDNERQFHNCHCCRHFMERFGGLVTIDDSGIASPVFWNPEDAAGCYAPGLEQMHHMVRRAKVTGVFLSKDPWWGTPTSLDPKHNCTWTHFAVRPSKVRVFAHKINTAFQSMAEKSEEFKTVQRALDEFKTSTLVQALTLLESESLYRAEHVIGPAKWLTELKQAVETGKNRANLVWRAVAMAPAGFCHPRSSMVGTLLDDIESGMSFGDASRRFADKMNPLKYQRPQAAPTAGNIAAAEKLVEKLGIAPSLERRFARLDEITALWRHEEQTGAAPSAGVFAHLTPKGAEVPPELNAPPKDITWVKFRDTVLATAKSIELMVPHRGNFAAILTAVNLDAPPILQWDSEGVRNPFSWYLYNGESAASQWGLVGNAWRKVTAITLKPSIWNGGFEHHGTGALFVLDGAVDSRESGNALFPETLKAELREVRSVIEAYSRTAKIAGKEAASACGYLIPDGARVIVRATAKHGVRLNYRIDRWD